MYVILDILGSIALMIGSIAAGILSCWLLWSGFQRDAVRRAFVLADRQLTIGL